MSFLRWLNAQLYSALSFATLLSRCLVVWAECVRVPGRYFSYDRSQDKHLPTFILGCGHSGTSLLLALMGMHSHVCPIPLETHLAYDYNARQRRESPIAGLLLRFADLLTISRKKNRWVEKTPKHIYSIPLLRRIVPGCRFILILRDGRDVACSIETRYGSLEKGIQRWVDDNKAGEPFWDHDDVHVMKYEDIVEDPRKTMTAIFHFIGEKFEEDVLRSHEKPKYFYSSKIEKPPDATQKYHDQYRNWQINQKLFDGRGKWRDLSEDKKAIIKKHAGAMLVQYGYAADENW